MVALTAKLETLSMELKKPTAATTPGGRGGRGKGKNSRTLEDWETKAPKAGQPSTMKHANKRGQTRTYHWCPKHKRWVIHKPSECTLAATAQEVIAEETTTSERSLDIKSSFIIFGATITGQYLVEMAHSS